MKGHGIGGLCGVSRTLVALALTLLCSGCVGVGTAVRVATWHQDPSLFWIVVREEGVPEGRVTNTDGTCSVVFGNRGLPRQSSEVSRLNRDSGLSATLSCRPSADAIDGASTSVVLQFYGVNIPDLSLPKSGRQDPRLLREKTTAETLESGLFYFRLYGVRFGATLFCPTILVHVTSFRVVLNAGVDRDLHVIVGEGTRECSFP